ncbi:hypothetical protein GCM10027168_36030 [Streptomyces capparidis]
MKSEHSDEFPDRTPHPRETEDPQAMADLSRRVADLSRRLKILNVEIDNHFRALGRPVPKADEGN